MTQKTDTRFTRVKTTGVFLCGGESVCDNTFVSGFCSDCYIDYSQAFSAVEINHLQW